jgi:hypothetical protein
MGVNGTAAARSRREVLRVGALLVAGGAFVAGCSSDDPSPDVEPGGQAGGKAISERATGPEVDVGLLNTALSLEILAIDTYQVASDFSLIASRDVVEAAGLFQQHHRDHRDALVVAVETAGGEPFMTANPVVKAALVDPSLVSVAAERDFVTLARDVEQAAAQLYVHATTRLSTQELRSTTMSIGAVTSRQATILDLLADLGNERLATFPTDNPLPSDAIVGS